MPNKKVVCTAHRYFYFLSFIAVVVVVVDDILGYSCSLAFCVLILFSGLFVCVRVSARALANCSYSTVHTDKCNYE